MNIPAGRLREMPVILPGKAVMPRLRNCPGCVWRGLELQWRKITNSTLAWKFFIILAQQ
jgi:hypothetical protein